MLRRIGQRDPDLVGQRLDAALALGEQLEQLEPVRAGQRLPDTGELSVEAVLEEAVRVGHSQLFSRLVECRLSNLHQAGSFFCWIGGSKRRWRRWPRFHWCWLGYGVPASQGMTTFSTVRAAEEPCA